jgi:sugar phosphate isomerase/epimerase
MTLPVVAAQLYTLRDYVKTAADFAGTAKKVRALGYTAVQVSGIGPIADGDVKAALDDAGLACCITHVRTPWPWPDLDAVIAQHKLWKCPNVAIGSMPGPYRADEAGVRRFAAEANEVGRKLHEAGLTFSYHNHSFEFVRYGRRTALELLYQETDPRYLKAELDTYWVQHGGGDPAAWIRKMKNRMPVVHFKDMTVLNDQPAMAEIGEGNLNWPAILDACREANVAWCAVEQDVCQRNPFESLKISYNNLKAMGLQ